ncbi:MAG TPA: type IV toxin-antitoxin system AbiEi family antitoxin domain-containing protein [Solirubrobacterales bacterium]
MREEVARPDLVAAGIAAPQFGVISIRQLRDAGLSDDAVSRRVRAGRLHRIHRGVYAVGHWGLPVEGRWMAAVFACGDEAVVSHRTAAALWKLLPSAGGTVDVSVPGDSGKAKRKGIRLHRSATLEPRHVTRRRGIPTTNPARTLDDLRRAVPANVLRRAVREAAVLGLKSGNDAVVDGTRSELEYLFLQLCRRHRLPTPAVNVPLGPLLADFLWREQRLVVETDGYRFHRGRAAFEDDHDRALLIRALGYEVIRLSCRQVVEAPEFVAGVLREALSL